MDLCVFERRMNEPRYQGRLYAMIGGHAGQPTESDLSTPNQGVERKIHD